MYTLSDIVNEFLVENGDGQTNKFARFYQFGLSFLRRTNFNTSGFPKVVELHIHSNDTANLPNDYVRYTRIALCSNGRLFSLGQDDNLCLNKAYNDCGQQIAQGNTTNNLGGTGIIGAGFLGFPMVADHFTNGEFMGRMFGIGGDNNCFGYYRIDKPSNKILFRDLAQSCTVVLEYLADVSAIDGDFEVHPFAIEALKDWIQWKYKQRSSKPLGEQQLAQQNFNESNRLMRMMFLSSTKDEWIAAFATGNQASPKM